MAKAKKSKTKKSKAKNAKAKKSKPSKVKKTAKKAKPAAAKARPKKASKAPARKAAAKKPASKTPAKKAKQIVGEGDYAASKRFLKDQSSFVKRNQARIPALGKAAEKALEGPEGDDLRAAEEAAKSHSKA